MFRHWSVLSHLKPRIGSRHLTSKKSMAGSTLEISISNSCAILAAADRPQTANHITPGMYRVRTFKSTSEESQLSPPNIVSKSWKCIATVALPRRISVTSPPFQEVLARSVRALMPFAAMMRSFFCICRLKRLTRWHFCFLEKKH